MQSAEDLISLTSERFRQYICAICVFLGGLCTGTVLSWTSPALPQLLEQGIISQNEEGIVGSMLALGGLISAIPAGYLADKVGRKKALMLLVIPFMANWILIIFANGSVMLYIARFFAGLAAGASSVCSLMYIGEIAEASIRGALCSLYPMIVCVGILLTAVFGAFLSWRWLSVFLGIMPLIYGVSMIFIPESPLYLLKIDQIARAKEVLAYFRGDNYKDLEKELFEMQNLIKEGNDQKMEFMKAFSSKANRKAIVAGIGIMSFQQLSGINAVTFYMVPIFQSTGSTLSPNLATIIYDIVQVIATILPIILVERANRKFYLHLSAFGSAVCLAALGIYFHLQLLDIKIAGMGSLPLVSLIVYILMFNIGFGSIPWTIISELFAPEIKAVGSGLGLMTCWISIFVVTLAFPLMNTHLGGHIIFYIFAVVLAVGALFVHFFIPETKGKTLQEIQDLLNR